MWSKRFYLDYLEEIPFNQVTHVSKISGRNIVSTRQRYKDCIAEASCANSSCTLKWPRELRYGNWPTAHFIKGAAMRCHITSKCIRSDIAIEHEDRVAKWARDVPAMSDFNYRARLSRTTIKKQIILDTDSYLYFAIIVLINHCHEISPESRCGECGKYCTRRCIAPRTAIGRGGRYARACAQPTRPPRKPGQPTKV